jgi:hypothetical protein
MKEKEKKGEYQYATKCKFFGAPKDLSERNSAHIQMRNL